MIQNQVYNKKLTLIYNLFKDHIKDIKLLDKKNQTFILDYINPKFWRITLDLNCNKGQFQQLLVKKQFYDDNKTYLILANNWIYFIVQKIQNTQRLHEIDPEFLYPIYDFGVITLPLFQNPPIFNPTLPNAKIIYGLNTNYKISCVISPNTVTVK